MKTTVKCGSVLLVVFTELMQTIDSSVQSKPFRTSNPIVLERPCQVFKVGTADVDRLYSTSFTPLQHGIWFDALSCLRNVLPLEGPALEQRLHDSA